MGPGGLADQHVDILHGRVNGLVDHTGDGFGQRLFLGGVLVAFYVLSITWIAPTMGVGNAVFLVLLGQLVSAAAIDHFGLFTAQASPLTLTRMAGIALMAAGVFVTQKV